MSATIITSLITASIPALALIIVQLIVSAKQQRIQDIKFDMTIKEVRADISRLEAKQDKHNALIERMVNVERDTAAQWKWIDSFKEK